MIFWYLVVFHTILHFVQKTPAENLYSVLTMVEIKRAFHANVEYKVKTFHFA